MLYATVTFMIPAAVITYQNSSKQFIQSLTSTLLCQNIINNCIFNGYSAHLYRLHFFLIYNITREMILFRFLNVKPTRTFCFLILIMQLFCIDVFAQNTPAVIN